MTRFEEMPDTPEFSNHSKPDEVIHFRTKPGDELMDENGNYRNYAGYQILSELGHGGGGIVYRARKLFAEHPVDVALKRPHPNSLLDPKFKEILKREAKRMSKLEHDYILRVLDWSDDPNEPYLVTPLMENGSLAYQLAASRGKLPFRSIIKWAKQLALALDFIHRKINIYHGDIKPHNAFVDAKGNAVLADFGLFRSEHHDSLHTSEDADEGMGTPEFLPPEVFHGFPRIDKVGDLYGLGALIYMLITGKCPYAQIDKESRIKAIKDGSELTPIDMLRPDAPVKLIHIVERCMDRERDNRFPSAKSIFNTLNALDDKNDKLHWLRMRWTRKAQRITHQASLAAGCAAIGWAALSYFQHSNAGVTSSKPLPLQPSGPRLELVHEFEIPESFRKYRLLRPCQWFPDNRSELVFVSDSEAAVFTPIGEELIRFGAKSLKFSQHGGGIMTSDVNGDGLEELFLAGRINNTLEARVFNQNAFELNRFQVEGSYDPTAESAIDSSNSFLTTNVWEDIDGDGRPEFLVVIRTGHLLQPRSLICFDGQTEEIIWRWDTGAEIVQVITHDLDSDGKKEVLFACASVANGAIGPDGRSDNISTIGALTSSGEELWIKATGVPMTNPWIHPMHNDSFLIQISSQQSPLPVNQSTQFSLLNLDQKTIKSTSDNAIPQNGLLVLDSSQDYHENGVHRLISHLLVIQEEPTTIGMQRMRKVQWKKFVLIDLTIHEQKDSLKVSD